ncbi:MAG: hypothetical protein KF784_10125 [Fimbriimonadaceae bacterium]|nr:hypothetical protein [Fimbriimonadaceae bacterium]
MSKPEMARPIAGPKRRKFPWLALVLLLGSVYAFWILPWQLNGQKEFVGPQAAPEVKTSYANSTQPPASKATDETKGQKEKAEAHPKPTETDSPTQP